MDFLLLGGFEKLGAPVIVYLGQAKSYMGLGFTLLPVFKWIFSPAGFDK